MTVKMGKLRKNIATFFKIKKDINCMFLCKSGKGLQDQKLLNSLFGLGNSLFYDKSVSANLKDHKLGLFVMRTVMVRFFVFWVTVLAGFTIQPF